MTHTPETIKLIYTYIKQRSKLKEIKKELTKKGIKRNLIGYYTRKK